MSPTVMKAFIKCTLNIKKPFSFRWAKAVAYACGWIGVRLPVATNLNGNNT